MYKSFAAPLVFFVLSTVGVAQEEKISPSALPAAVVASSAQRFPGAKLSGWSKETEDGKTTYEVSVLDAKAKRDAVFSENGDLVAVEQSMRLRDLPTQIKTALQARYPGATIKKVERITKGEETQYEVALANIGKKEVLLSADGKILEVR